MPQLAHFVQAELTLSSVYQFKDFEGSSHRILIRLVRRLAPRGGTLLDLGAAHGEIGNSLRDHFSRTIGFEYDAGRIAELKERYDSVVIGNLETQPHHARADAVVMADVLEHLRNPEDVLMRARAALRPGGLLFISVPNVANVTVRAALLAGSFRYADRGILDRTHIRFYTFESIREQVEAAGFEIIETHASSMPIRLVLEGKMPGLLLSAGERLLSLVTRVWKRLFAYQVILVARPLHG